MTLPQQLSTLQKRLNQLLLFIAGACLVSIMFLGFADVFARYLFSASLVQREELFRVGLITIFATSFPVISLNREHLSVDLLDNVFFGIAKKIQRILVDATIAVSCGVMGYWMWDKSERISRVGREVMFEELGLQQGHFAKFFAIVLFVVAIVILLMVIVQILALCFKQINYEYVNKSQENL